MCAFEVDFEDFPVPGGGGTLPYPRKWAFREKASDRRSFPSYSLFHIIRPLAKPVSLGFYTGDLRISCNSIQSYNSRRFRIRYRPPMNSRDKNTGLFRWCHTVVFPTSHNKSWAVSDRFRHKHLLNMDSFKGNSQKLKHRCEILA